MTHSEKNDSKRQFVVIGAGPAGLTAAYELTRHDFDPVVLEKDHTVGGLARTENYKGYYFDMGGHRFFTKSKEVNQMWQEVLDGDFLKRPRLSRIYYNHKFFHYPIKPFNALARLGIWQSALVACSYLRWQIFPYRQEETFEEWVTNRFGKRLFETFFKTYTEKVWGIPCSELKAEWAAQRIKDLSLKTALLNTIWKPKETIKTLIEEFDYPRRGPGMMWKAVQEHVVQAGGSVDLNSPVVEIKRNGSRICSVVVEQNGTRKTVEGTDFISSMPVTEFVKKLRPAAPSDVLKAAEQLKYRDFLTVCLIVNQKELFPDNWIYIHDSEVKIGRIQNFKNWSPDMVPDPEKSSLGLEYFCSEGDELWNTPDQELIEMGKREVAKINLAREEDIEDGCVFRVPKSYPVYDSDYRNALKQVRQFVDDFENFKTIGRNGLHRYNNQDHAMLTGMYAVRNLVLNEQYNLWEVNAEQEYHEEIREIRDEDMPQVADVVQEALARVFSKLDPVAFGMAIGSVCGLILFLATLTLVLKGGEVVGPTLWLLSQYLPGYTVTLWGSLTGLLYGTTLGFIAGWSFAFLRNTIVFIYLAFVRRGAEMRLMRRLLDYIY